MNKAKILALEKKLRLFAVADITCDFEGSIELFKKYTSIDHPYFMINPETGEIKDEMD